MRTLALLAIVAFFGITMLVSIQPSWFEFAKDVPGRDKLFHFVGAGLMCFFIVTGLSTVVVRGRTYGSFSLLAATTLLITLEEFSQLAISSRTFDLTDLGWSYAGIAVFGLPSIWLRRVKVS